jgi:ABC-2 type transport system ATP-binding protein
MNIIKCSNLVKRYDPVAALQDMTFTLEENKITGLIGPNGAGKTTLMRIIAGFTLPTAGELKVLGHTPFNNLSVSQNLIYIDDNLPLPTGMAIKDILTEAGKFYPNWNMELALRLFEYFGLNPNQRYQKLSKGKKSTFGVIIGLAARCPLTIFDEPTTGMDAEVRKDFYRALLKEYLQHPRTILLSSHLLNEIEDVLEDVLLVKEGKAVLHLPMEDLREYAIGLRGKTEVIHQLIQGRTILRQEGFAKDSSYVVIAKEQSQDIRQRAKLAGVKVLPVATADLCVYLTSTNKGGIDDVFAG